MVGTLSINTTFKFVEIEPFEYEYVNEKCPESAQLNSRLVQIFQDFFYYAYNFFEVVVGGAYMYCFWVICPFCMLITIILLLRMVRDMILKFYV